MSNSTTQGHGEQSSTSFESVKIPKEQSSELVKMEDVEGTPFKIVRNNEVEWFLTLGDARITPVMNSREDIQIYMDTNMWELLLTMIVYSIDKLRPMANKMETMPEHRARTENNM